ncbi:hypothetical protein KC906_04005 [Candidatus Kaiserbacteria bacterium]|nr:hypothetical protein [Candidatus Kaiserbacteria bacterium]
MSDWTPDPDMWKCVDGLYVRVCDMQTRHIKRSLAMLRAKGFVSPSTVSFYLSGPMPNGDAAMIAYEEEQDYVFNAPVSRFIDLFEQELKKRSEEIY